MVDTALSVLCSSSSSSYAWYALPYMAELPPVVLALVKLSLLRCCVHNHVKYRPCNFRHGGNAHRHLLECLHMPLHLMCQYTWGNINHITNQSSGQQTGHALVQMARHLH